MHCVTTVVVAADYAEVHGRKVRIVCQNPESSYAEDLRYAFIASPFPEYRCAIVWGEKGLYGVFLSTCGVVEFPELFKKYPWKQPWLDVHPDQTDTSAPVDIEIPEQARGTLVLSGTPFQCRVWRTLLCIPGGEFRYYADIACAAGSPRAWRAAASAVAANPLLWLVPCHRVLPRRGGVGSYRCGSDFKRLFLAREGIFFSDERLP
jgi:AraC family transcriptional regulator of adaptative response/methylated-DNA-[protein]-cysteine methyltransferase